MPLRFTLFKTSTIINLLLVIFTIAEIIYVSFAPDITLTGDAVPYIIAAVIVFIYLGNIYWGFKLCKKYTSGDGISKEETNTISIFFAFQLICQLLMLINLPEAVKNLEEPLAINLHMRRYNHIVLQFLPLVIFVVTCCCQLLLFPFMKLIRQRHKAFLENMNHLGKTEIAP